MRLATLVTATALGLAGFATAYLYHDKSDPPQRYGSWQELSAAQPSCKSMTNLSECICRCRRLAVLSAGSRLRAARLDVC